MSIAGNTGRQINCSAHFHFEQLLGEILLLALEQQLAARALEDLLEVGVAARQAAVLPVDDEAVGAKVLFHADDAVWLEHAATALLSRVTCGVWRVACDVRRATCDVWRVTCDKLWVTGYR
jgi:hypothetical protein